MSISKDSKYMADAQVYTTSALSDVPLKITLNSSGDSSLFSNKTCWKSTVHASLHTSFLNIQGTLLNLLTFWSKTSRRGKDTGLIKSFANGFKTGSKKARSIRNKNMNLRKP